MTLTVRPFGAAMRMCLLLLGLLALTQTANADCANPAGTSGDMTYNTTYNVMTFCNGTNWISMAGATSVGVSDPRIGTISAGGWCKGNGGGTGLDCTASAPGVSPSGVTGDVQFNNGGFLGSDTGKFTYSSNVLSAPIVSASSGNITTLNSNVVNNTGLGTFGSILDNGGLTVLGAASMTTISASAISGTIIQVGEGGGAACNTTLTGSLRYNSTSNTIQICSNNVWTSLNSGTITGSGVSGGSATAIAFWNGPSSLTYESATTSGLYWDTANKRLGVGTNSPSTPLDVLNSNGSAYINATSYREYALGGGLQFLHARGTLVSPSALQVGDVGGSIYFKGYDGGSFLNMAAIQSVMDSTPVSGTNLTGTLSFFTTPSSSLNVPLERMRISSGGNVGIGTQSPTTPLQVSGTATMNVANLVSQTVTDVVGGLGNIISSGSAVVSTSSAGSITFFTGGARRMTMDSSGRLGLGGTTLPDSDARLTVEDAVTDYARIRVRNTSNTATSGAGYYFGNTSSGGYASFVVQNSAANTSFGGANSLNMYSNWGNLTFGVNVSGTSTERVRIDTNGNMQIGGTATYGGANARLTVYYVGGGTQHGLTLKPTTDSTNPIDFLNASGSYVGSITQNTTNTTYNTTSDRRVKEHITDTREGLQKLMLLPVRDFQFRSDPSHTTVTGFIAQELEKVFPEAVTTNGDNGETPLRDKSKPWSVDYGRVTPLIVKAVQELKVANDNLAKENATLKAANDNLERRIEVVEKKLAR